MIKKILSLSPILLFILAITNNKIIYDGVVSAIKLILFTVIPTLFPFILLSDVMVNLNTTDSIAFILTPLTKFFRISQSCGYAISTGLLCGYPIGAKSCADLVKAGKISISEGNYLLSFVNNASPAFLSSYIVVRLLHESIRPSYMFFVCYTSTFVTALILNPIYIQKSIHSDNSPDKQISTSRTSSDNIFSLDRIFSSSIHTMLKISSYILIFSVLCEFITYIPYIAPKIMLSGLFEITTGTFFISVCTIPKTLKLQIITFFTMLGGLSAFFQTRSMISESGLSIKWYIIGRLIASFLSVIIINITI